MIIGDERGTVHCYAVKKRQLQELFVVDCESAITSICLGGQNGEVGHDRIFVASGSEVKGINRKGKIFWIFDTNITESITSIHVDGNHLYTCGDYSFNHFLESSERDSYVSNERINDMVVLHAKLSGDVFVALACQDRCIRVLNAGALVHEIQILSPPNALCVYHANADEIGQIIYGTSSGTVGCIQVTSDLVVPSWTINVRSNLPTAGVSCLQTCNPIKELSDLNHLVVGRSDGTVQVFTLKPLEIIGVEVSSSTLDEPILLAENNVGELVSCLAAGTASAEGSPEIILATYSGKVVGLVNSSITIAADTLERRISTGTVSGSEIQSVRKGSKDFAEKQPGERIIKKASFRHEESRTDVTEKSDMLGKQIELLRQEVEALKLQEREQRQIADQKNQNDIKKKSVLQDEPDKGRVLVLPPSASFSATASLKLNEDTGTLTLIVQASVALDTIAICPDFPVIINASSIQRLSEVNGQFGKYTTPENPHQYAACRFLQPNAKFAEFEVQVTEGQQGRLHLYITPQFSGAAAVIVQEIDVFVKPLSLHVRHHLVDDIMNERANSLRLDGDFSFAEIHSWLMKCLPDIPDRTPSTSSTATYHFRSVILDTRVTCECRSGKAIIYAENPSVISILRDAITKEATTKKRTTNIANEFNPVTVLDIVTKVAKRLERIRKSKFEAGILQGLKELQGAEPDLSFLPAEWKDLLSRASEPETKLMEELAKLHAVLLRLRTDVLHFNGKSDTPALKSFLENWNLLIRNGNVTDDDKVELREILMSFFL